MVKVLVTAKVNPDLDVTACALSYADLLNKLGGEAEGLMFGFTQIETQYFTEKYDIKIPSHDNDGEGDWVNLVLVDSSSMKGMPKVVKAEKVIEVIDHRIGQPEKEFPVAKIQNELVGAAATLIVEKFIEAHLLPREDHAKLLYGAIFENTLNFLATNATDRDREAVKYLEEKFNINKDLVPEMFKFSTQRILSDLRTSINLDAKDFEGFAKVNSLYALQLTVFGIDFEKIKEELAEIVHSLVKDKEIFFSFLNLIDLKKGQSYIFASNKKGEEILAKALGVTFSNQWATLTPPILRKQIIPKISFLIAPK